MYSAAYVWAKVLARMEQQLSEVTVSTWLDDAEVIELTDKRLVLYSPSDFRQEAIRSRCTEYIEAALEELLHAPIKLEVWGETELKDFREEKRSIDSIPFNPQFSFRSFVESPANRFAKRITEMAAAHPGTATCNPLFLYGEPGVGKTHLLYAAANHMIETRPEMKVICMKAEAFTNELVRSIIEGRNAAFRSKFRKADALLLDDIQFIAGKESTQEEFFHTFNALYESGHQIILTSDRRPNDMATLTTRLKDRFGEGVLVEITAPDPASRLEIVRLKAEKYGLSLNEECMQMIANAGQNIRQAEGMLKKLRAYRDLNGVRLSTETVAALVEELSADRVPKKATTAMVLHQVCRYYGVTDGLLKSKTRNKTAAEPRQLAMYLLSTMLEMRHDEIAKLFNRDRATVIYSIQKVDQQLSAENSVLGSVVAELRSNIEASIESQT